MEGIFAMNESDVYEIHEDLTIGDEQVTANECWVEQRAGAEIAQFPLLPNN